MKKEEKLALRLKAEAMYEDEKSIALGDIRQQLEAKSKHFFPFFWTYAGFRFWKYLRVWKDFKRPVYIYYGIGPFTGFLDKYQY